jgi:hypothetical protein
MEVRQGEVDLLNVIAKCCWMVMELKTTLHEKCSELLRILASKCIRLSELGAWWFPVVVESLQGICQGC